MADLSIIVVGMVTNLSDSFAYVKYHVSFSSICYVYLSSLNWHVADFPMLNIKSVSEAHLMLCVSLDEYVICIF